MASLKPPDRRSKEITKRSSYLKRIRDYQRQVIIQQHFSLHLIPSTEQDGYIFSRWQQVVWSSRGCCLYKAHRGPCSPAWLRQAKVRSSWLLTLHYLRRFSVLLLQTECGGTKHRGRQTKAEIHVVTAAAFLIVQFIFTRPPFCCTTDLFSGGEVCCTFAQTPRALDVSTLFCGCVLRFKLQCLFISSLCLVNSFHFQIDLKPLCALMFSGSWSVHQKIWISAARLFICFKCVCVWKGLFAYREKHNCFRWYNSPLVLGLQLLLSFIFFANSY